MPGLIVGYVRVVDALNYRIGRIVMYGIFVMVGVLLWSSVSKTFFLPSLWTLEIAQFALVAYYLMGGPYSMQLAANVRMDLFYGNWSPRKKAWMDVFTIWFLIFYLVVMIHGAIGSTAYSLGHFGDDPYAFFRGLAGAFVTGGPEGAAGELGYIERSPTAWRPYLWPVKVIACVGIFLMLLQAVSEFFKDLATLRGVDLRSGEPAHRHHEEALYEDAD
ncbi:MAG: TRAP transporter small permease subunit [Rhodobacteraceae bacterium]|nr:TRAP transporter small permease subunit [Paracoccaceae bacterium]